MTNEEKQLLICKFINLANGLAVTYECGFIEPTVGEDEKGVFVQTNLYPYDDIENGFVGDEEMPKLRLIEVLVQPELQRNAILVEWLDGGMSICIRPDDLFSVFNI